MKGMKLIGSVAIIALLLVGSAVLLAQKAEKADAGVLVQTSGDRAWMGVHLSEVPPSQVSQLKLQAGEGALISEVEKDGPAAKAGLEPNDVVLRFDGERVRSVAELRRLVRETPPGRTVEVEISRDGNRHKFHLTLDSHPENRSFVGPHFDMHMPAIEIPRVTIPSFDFNLSSGPSRLGITADDLTPQLAKYFGVTQGKGVLVTSVMKSSPAEKAGLRAGDCIVRADTTPVGSIWELRQALAESSRAKREVNLSVVRDRAQQDLKVELEATWHAPSLSAEDREDLPELAPELEELQQEMSLHHLDLEKMQHELQGEAVQRATLGLRQNLEQLRHNLDRQKHTLNEQSRQLLDQKRHLRDDIRQRVRELATERAVV